MICSAPSSFGSRSATNCMNSSASQSRPSAVQRLQREGRVADPRVAVVPVALAAGRLRQRGGQRGDHRAGGHVGQALEGQRRALRSARASGGREGARGRASARQKRRSWLDALAVASSTSRGDAELLGPRQRAERPLARLAARGAPARGRPRSPSARSAAGGSSDPAPVASAAWRVVADQRPARRACGRSRRPARRPARPRRSPSTHSIVRTSRWSASSSVGGRVCGVIVSCRGAGPIVSASRTTTQPVGVCQVVSSTFVPGT